MNTGRCNQNLLVTGVELSSVCGLSVFRMDVLQDLLKSYSASQAEDVLVSPLSASPRAKGLFKAGAIRGSVQSWLLDSLMHSQLPSTPW